MAARTPCFRRCSTRSTTSPSQQGGEGTDSEDVWMITEESAILVMSTSLLGKISILPSYGGTFYPRLLQAISRCAIRGTVSILAFTKRCILLLPLPCSPEATCVSCSYQLAFQV